MVILIGLHLTAATRFAGGDFSSPKEIHAQVPPGSGIMKARKNLIRYQYTETPAGAAVRITSSDADARKAIHSSCASRSPTIAPPIRSTSITSPAEAGRGEEEKREKREKRRRGRRGEEGEEEKRRRRERILFPPSPLPLFSSSAWKGGHGSNSK